jgi:hypothetical protein
VTAPALTPKTDAACLTRLLRQHRRPLCTSCAAARLAMDTPRVLEAIAEWFAHIPDWRWWLVVNMRSIARVVSRLPLEGESISDVLGPTSRSGYP